MTKTRWTVIRHLPSSLSLARSLHWLWGLVGGSIITVATTLISLLLGAPTIVVWLLGAIALVVATLLVASVLGRRAAQQALKEELASLWHSFAYPALDAAQTLLGTICSDLAKKERAEALLSNLVQAHVIDGSHRARALFYNGLIMYNAPGFSDANVLQANFVEFFRAYELLVCWIQQTSELSAFRLQDDFHYRPWRELHGQFRNDLRRLSGKSVFTRLREGLKDAGWNEGIRQKLPGSDGSAMGVS